MVGWYGACCRGAVALLFVRIGKKLSVDEAGKHWKAVYQEDDRYTFTISKTSSDHRAGKNLASTILKKLFK